MAGVAADPRADNKRCTTCPGEAGSKVCWGLTQDRLRSLQGALYEATTGTPAGGGTHNRPLICREALYGPSGEAEVGRNPTQLA